MKAWILKRKHKKNNDKYFTHTLSWSKVCYKPTPKPVRFDECFKTKQMAERYLSSISDELKKEMYVVEVEIREVEDEDIHS